MNAPPSLEQQLYDLISDVDTAIGNINAGVPVDLGRLEELITRVCTDVSHADQQEARGAKPLMATLISRMDELTERCRIMRDQNKDTP